MYLRKLVKNKANPRKERFAVTFDNRTCVVYAYNENHALHLAKREHGNPLFYKEVATVKVANRY